MMNLIELNWHESMDAISRDGNRARLLVSVGKNPNGGGHESLPLPTGMEVGAVLCRRANERGYR